MAPVGNGVTLPSLEPRESGSRFGWEQRKTRHTNGLSIQSLISSPGTENGHEERGMKRKGSDITDRDDDRSSRGTSVVSTTGLSMEDPDVRDAVEALGGLKAGMSWDTLEFLHLHSN